VEEGRNNGAVEEISREHARLGELGYVLMFRSLGQVDDDRDELVEGVPASGGDVTDRCPARADPAGPLEKAHELVAAHARGVNDLKQGSTSEIPSVHGNDDTVLVLGVTKDMVAALGPVQLPAASF
jgi:hypothetical protein